MLTWVSNADIKGVAIALAWFRTDAEISEYNAPVSMRLMNLKFGRSANLLLLKK
ncbi:hypothetical protein IQ268_20725 [Oculatella sp. LEGE 06141]|uniref:hypothetical protein n=1 Tax=Oculatella sp. LEGE 06141 TaxID=1828648 RepID=UPI00187E6879|nr:hypothetical protein [Oculatella sp. LEGE 06141]MBE9180987.1 hypothetical protein [Oculatella sp. LEGE 06141]